MSVNLTLYPLETELHGVFWLRANGQEEARFHYLILQPQLLSCCEHVL